MRDQRTDESVISPELQLAVECCRHNFAGNRGSVAPRPSAGLDWQGFLALVRFHRVQGLAWKALDDAGLAPPAIAEALSRDTEKIAAANLRAAAESRDLLDDFEAAEVPALFVKGLTGAALAYRHPSAQDELGYRPAGRAAKRRPRRGSSSLAEDIGS